jgi:hypothetical protein
MTPEQDALILGNLRIVSIMVRRAVNITRMNTHRSELEGVARLALVEAADNYSKRGVCKEDFSRWASACIKHAIMNYMQKNDTMTPKQRRIYNETGVIVPIGVTKWGKPGTEMRRRIHRAYNRKRRKLKYDYRLDVDAIRRGCGICL